ncbi:MAG: phosphatidylserine decarboxylase [Neisseria sp.]|nr:phosphatidylserine decarboxylase [Neisseria sp.]
MSVPAYPHPIIAREGWGFIAAFAAVAIVLSFVSGWLAAPFWLLTVFAVQFFRDPARESGSDDENAVLAPADGRIVVVEKTLDPFRNREALKISVFMNVFNVHSNRSPLSGTVQKTEYFAGSFLNAAVDKASTHNERNAVLLQTATGTEITFVQIAGLVARRILCYAKSGDQLMRGERYGLIRFGSRVDVYLPPDATAKVVIGDKVKATSTVLAQLAE